MTEGLTSPKFAGKCRCQRGQGQGKGGGHGRWGQYWVISKCFSFCVVISLLDLLSSMYSFKLHSTMQSKSKFLYLTASLQRSAN